MTSLVSIVVAASASYAVLRSIQLTWSGPGKWSKGSFGGETRERKKESIVAYYPRKKVRGWELRSRSFSLFLGLSFPILWVLYFAMVETTLATLCAKMVVLLNWHTTTLHSSILVVPLQSCMCCPLWPFRMQANFQSWISSRCRPTVENRIHWRSFPVEP